MKLKKLIQQGYFPKELPPCFNTYDLGNLLSDKLLYTAISDSKVDLKAKKLDDDSSYIRYSIVSYGTNRRTVAIPNPIYQIELSKAIADDWKQINAIISKSKISFSKPKSSTQSERAVVPQKNFSDFKRSAVETSYEYMFELHTDILRFYNSVYSHSIPWAIHSKKTAKQKRYDKSLLGNKLDVCLRNTQSKQTYGMPIGPDTSLIIAEIICCTMDMEISKRLPDNKCFRYFDDYIVCCRNSGDADNALRVLQDILAAYKFELNDTKTYVSKIPGHLEKDWAIAISSYNFRKGSVQQALDLERFFSLVFRHQDKNPRDAVVKYALQTVENLPVDKDNQKLFESFLLKCCFIDPTSIPHVVSLMTKSTKIEKRALSKCISALISENAVKRNGFEVSWALWVAYSFNLKLSKATLVEAFNSEDIPSQILLMVLKGIDKSSKTKLTALLKSSLSNEDFFGEKWLLGYEALRNGWLKSSDLPNFANQKFVQYLLSKNVSFLDLSLQVKQGKVGNTIMPTNNVRVHSYGRP